MWYSRVAMSFWVIVLSSTMEALIVWLVSLRSQSKNYYGRSSHVEPMKLFSETHYHEWFRWGVILKGIISVGEIILGITLYFVTYETLKHALFFFVGGEITETPRDLFWGYLAKASRDFTTEPESFWAFLFISHGAVKSFLAWGLWKEKLWAFPTAAIVFVGFIAYQLYQLTYLNSVSLWAITIFDVVLIVLILHEYRHRRRRLTAV